MTGGQSACPVLAHQVVVGEDRAERPEGSALLEVADVVGLFIEVAEVVGGRSVLRRDLRPGRGRRRGNAGSDRAARTR